MQFTGLAVGVAILALLILVLGLRILWRGRWFLAWLRGSLGLGVLALAGLAGLVAYDVTTYQEQQASQSVALLHVGTGSSQTRYQVTLEYSGGTRQFLLDGELWGMQVQQLDWHGIAKLIGLQPGYRVAEVNARFLGMEQQNAARYTAYSLKPAWSFDLWQVLQRLGGRLSFVEAKAATLGFIPLVEGGSYRVEWLPTGLQVKPLNAEAREAIHSWVD